MNQNYTFQLGDFNLVVKTSNLKEFPSENPFFDPINKLGAAKNTSFLRGQLSGINSPANVTTEHIFFSSFHDWLIFFLKSFVLQ